MKLLFDPGALEDYDYFKSTQPAVATRIRDLLTDIRQHPFTGIGKPEPLKGPLTGLWSRRITGDHRLVYRVTGTPPDQVLQILKCRYHY